MTRRNTRTKVPALIKQAALDLAPLTNAYQVQARIKNELPYMTPEVAIISYHLAHGGYARPTGRKVSIRVTAPDPAKHSRLLTHHRQVAEFEILEGCR